MSENRIELPDLLEAVADQRCVEMLKEITEREREGLEPLEIPDGHTRRTYYYTLNKLARTSQIKKVGTAKYRPTLLGRIVNELVQTAQAACDSHWRLQALENMLSGQIIPEEEKEGLVERLIPDAELRRMIYQRNK